MTFYRAVVTALQKGTTYAGRATRAEFWYFTLFYWGVYTLLLVLDYRYFAHVMDAQNLAPLSLSWCLIFLPANVAVTCRRLHDIGKNGWWQLVQLTVIGVVLLLCWAVRESDPGDNAYGPRVQ